MKRSFASPRSPTSAAGSGEAGIFWGGLILAPALWAVLFVVALSRFNFQWIILVIIALTLTASNLFGYVRQDVFGTFFGAL